MTSSESKHIHHLKEWVFDCNTGEVLWCYEVVPYQPKLINICTRHFYNSRDMEELNEIVKKYNEKRFSEVTYNLDKKSLGKFYVPILTLCSRLNYYNVGFYTRDEISEVFKVKVSSINKLLNKFVDINLMRYTGIGLSNSNMIRIIWNPLNIWKGYYGTTRNVSIEEWYKGLYGVDVVEDCAEDIKSGLVVELDDSWDMCSPDPYISPFFHTDSKSNFEKLMKLTDVDFELRLLSCARNINYTV